MDCNRAHNYEYNYLYNYVVSTHTVVAADDMNRALFQAGAGVRDSLTSLAHHMDKY